MSGQGSFFRPDEEGKAAPGSPEKEELSMTEIARRAMASAELCLWLFD